MHGSNGRSPTSAATSTTPEVPSDARFRRLTGGAIVHGRRVKGIAGDDGLLEHGRAATIGKTPAPATRRAGSGGGRTPGRGTIA
jgi:hypothetical protein